MIEICWRLTLDRHSRRLSLIDPGQYQAAQQRSASGKIDFLGLRSFAGSFNAIPELAHNAFRLMYRPQGQSGACTVRRDNLQVPQPENAQQEWFENAVVPDPVKFYLIEMMDRQIDDERKSGQIPDEDDLEI